MSLYPSLEDMKVSQMIQAQTAPMPSSASVAYPSASAPYPTTPANLSSSSYPALSDMGLELTPEEIAMITSSSSGSNSAVQVLGPRQVVPIGNSTMIAPISGTSVGLSRAAVTNGIRSVTLCKDASGKVGMRVAAISKGVFVVMVQANSPAALVGLRFGDQILEINGQQVAGWTMDKVHGLIKKCPPNGIQLAVRDRPLERTITLHKDSTGAVGFQVKGGRIVAIVKDSSAARNGLLIDHNMLEVNGQNVVGLDDKSTRAIIENAGQVVTLTIIPSVIYDHMIKHTATSVIRKLMDHSTPDDL